jgi:hypothetical protein
MDRNATEDVLARSIRQAATDSQPAGVLEWTLRRLQTFACGLRGHDPVLQYERSRIFLRCTSCGHETPGWEVAPAATLVRRRAETRPSRQVPPDLAVARKIA